MQVNPSLISVHCVAHRLALAIGGAAKLTEVNHHLSTVDKIHSYFDKSAVRMAVFKLEQVSGAGRL